MKISFNGETGRFLAQASYSEKDILKASGFRWDPVKKLWWTDDRENALRLRSAFDQTAREATACAEKKMVESAGLSALIEPKDGFRFKTPEGLAPFGYQCAGVQFALGRKNTLIADEMGVGKTLQAIGVINETAPERTLIICPASLKLNWLGELRTWLFPLGDYKITVLYSDGKHRTHGTGSKTIYVVNYDIVGKFDLKSGIWDLMILDEAHALKNAKSKRTREIWGGKKQDAEGKTTIWSPIRAERTLALTGTPVCNKPSELWTLLQNLDPANWSGKWMQFVTKYCGAVRTKFGWDTSGATNLEELNKILRGTIMLRRLKGDVLTELPPKTRKITPLETTKEIRALLEKEEALQHILEVGIRNADPEKLAILQAVADAEGEKPTVVGELAKIRRMVGEIKAPLAVEYAKELLDGGLECLVIFAHHKAVVAALEEGLAEYGVVKIVGETGSDEREQAKLDFQAGKGRVFLGSIGAAGVGLTLTRATHTLFCEIDWVPGNLAQAEDRTHRVGQKGNVTSEYLIFEGSIDTTMIDCVEGKRSVINEITK